MSKETIDLGWNLNLNDGKDSRPLIRYRDHSGRPTCNENDDKCKFLREIPGQWWFWKQSLYGQLGVRDVCIIGSLIPIPISQREDDEGSLIPHKRCPIWEGVER